MEYCEFCKSIKDELQRMMGEAYDVRLERVLKNNHVAYNAVVILQKGRNMAPSVYLEEYFDRYNEGMNITDISLDIIVQYEKYKDGVDIDSEELMDYRRMRDSMFVKVINTAMNEELLQNTPHIDYYDLSMVAYIRFKNDGVSNATMNISNGHLRAWNIDSETLFRDAIANTRKNMPHQVSKMSDVMKAILAEKLRSFGYNKGDDEELDYALAESIEAIEFSEKELMYVLSNDKRMDGAVYLLFEDVMKKMADELESDMYIIPSSIHEVMILPKSEKIDYDELCKLVKHVNENDLDLREVLSDTVYIYERGRGIIWES